VRGINSGLAGAQEPRMGAVGQRGSGRGEWLFYEASHPAKSASVLATRFAEPKLRFG
jgi:hypothetical protein